MHRFGVEEAVHDPYNRFPDRRKPFCILLPEASIRVEEAVHSLVGCERVLVEGVAVMVVYIEAL